MSLAACSLPTRHNGTTWYGPGTAIGADVFSFASAQGDFIGQGATYHFSTFTIGRNPGRLRPLPHDPSPSLAPLTSVTISASGRDALWQLTLSAPGQHPLTPGTYTDAARQATSTIPGIDMSGAGHGCNRENGSFTIYEAVSDGDGKLTKFNASFAHTCEGTAGDEPMLVGYVRYHASNPTPIPKFPSSAGPLPSPTTPTTSAHPTEFAARSPAGAPIEGGSSVDHIPPAVPVKVGGTLGTVSVAAGDWSISLGAPHGEQLVPGNYPVASRRVLAARTGTGAGIIIIANSRGCNMESGSFTIYEIASDAGGKITRLNATFSESSCDRWSGPPLLGFVRYNATVPTPLPWP